MIRLLIFFVVINISILINFGSTYAKGIKGRFSIDNYYTKDIVESHNFNITTARLKFDITSIQKSNVNLHFKGAERIKTSKSDIGDNLPRHRIYAINFEFISFFNKKDLILGRQDIAESSGSSVDGVHLRFNPGRRNYYGAFAGLKASPYDESLNSDFSTAGTYYHYSKKLFSSDISFVRDMYKGKTDRTYISIKSMQTHFSSKALYKLLSLKDINLYQFGVLDIGHPEKSIDITSLNIGTNLFLKNNSRVSLYYSQFKSINLLQSMDFVMDRENQKRINLRLNYKIKRNLKFARRVLKNLNFYTLFNYKIRGKYNKAANKIQIGFQGNVPDYDIFFDLNGSKETYFTAQNNSIFFKADKRIFNLADAGVSFEYLNNKISTDTKSHIILINSGFLDFEIAKATTVSFNWDYVSEETFSTLSFFTNLNYRF